MATAIKYEVPNLDALDLHELALFARNIGFRHEIPDGVRRDLEQYAKLRLNANALRLMGKIAKSKAIEDQCDTLYRWIPAEYRW